MCPQWLSWACQYLPDLKSEEWLSFILGTLIVGFFAKDHYKIPTYAKTTIGEFIELAPESLTSAKRYNKGLYMYIALMFGLYLFFCFFWSKGLSAFLEIYGIKLGNQLWPIAAATAVTLIGVMGDKNLFGRIETALRSIAHESAYIPDAVISLSSALNGNFTITTQMAQQLGEANPAVLAQIAESQNGSIQTWLRAKFLFSRLELLRDDLEFQQLLNRPEDVRAFNFLNEERQNLADRVAQRLGENHVDLDDPLRKKVENFRSAVSVFLASLLWQGCGTELRIERKLTRLELLIRPADRNFLWNFMVRVLASLAVAATVTHVVLFFVNWQWQVTLGEDFWYLTIAVLIFFMTALFATKRREARFIAGNTDKALDPTLTALYCGLPIGFVAAIMTFAWHQAFAWHQDGLERFLMMLATGLCLAMLIAFLFEIVMRWAAQTPPTPGALRRLSGSMLSAPQDFRRMLGRAVLLCAAASFVMVFVLSWIGEAVIARGAPKASLDSARSYLTPLATGYSVNFEEDPKSYGAKLEDDRKQLEENFRVVSFKALLRKVNDAPAKIDRIDVDKATVARTTADILRECDDINLSLSSKLSDKILLSSCELNSEFTKELGEGKRLENFRNAMNRVAAAVKSLQQIPNYATPLTALGTVLPRALAGAGLWAILAAVFAASILLYRRSVLWDTINSKTLNEYTCDLATAPVLWLRTPIDELDNLTPLELIRYQDRRAALSDYLRASKQQSPLQSGIASQTVPNGDAILGSTSATLGRANVSALTPRLAARAPT
jgi:hypothetical protein